ncbi:hypothetical protein [Thauera sp. 2A1]|uniref:hypothetical protein n=1 Tax=Thauera sp. 2A1 TaxID=2570191 RepID=UPI001290B862|nr:hypothetical protein [Thauera sp. 2A1]KAI5914903.1 hypothetical protein GH664_10435 [Thauera sp. 2A1]
MHRAQHTPGATVRLYTCVNNAPGVLVASTTTDANGLYQTIVSPNTPVTFT